MLRLVSLLPAVMTALQQLGDAIGRTQARWLVGGSCGLLLQQVPLMNNPRDLDIYADEQEASRMHEALQVYTLDAPVYSETDIYRSILSHYAVNGITVELVGAFQVRNKQSVYEVRVSEGLYSYAEQIAVGDGRVALMPLAHELVFNLLRCRPDRYEPIADKIRLDPDRHLPAFQYIITHNQFHPTIKDRLQQLLGLGPDV